jgi:hypothetical protein
MRSTALCHTDIVRELAVLLAAVSSTAELVLGHSSDETFRVQVMDMLVAKLWRLEELYSQLERPGSTIYDLLHGTPLYQG